VMSSARNLILIIAAVGVSVSSCCREAPAQIKLQPEYSVGQPVIVEVEFPDVPEGAMPVDLQWEVGDAGYRPLSASSIAVWPVFGAKDKTLRVAVFGGLVTADGKYVPKSNRKFEAIAKLLGVAPDVRPDPKPDDPPLPPPLPDADAPIKEPGFRVLITYESQEPVPRWLNDADFRLLLNTVCVKGQYNAEWRMVDKDSPSNANAGVWPAALKRTEGKPVPWILISTGKTGFEGPLPADKAEAVALIKKYAEAK